MPDLEAGGRQIAGVRAAKRAGEIGDRLRWLSRTGKCAASDRARAYATRPAYLRSGDVPYH
jgi:hypothetical protein